MDAYTQYVKQLAAMGYSAEQIRGVLASQNLDGQTMATLMVAIGDASDAYAWYLEYVKALAARGVQRADAERDLAARGVDQAVISDLLERALGQPAPVAEPQAAAPAPAIEHDDAAEKQLEAAAEHLATVAEHLEKVVGKLEDAEHKLEPAGAPGSGVAPEAPAPNAAAGGAERLEAAADHLAEVASALEAAEHAPAAPSPGPPATPPPAAALPSAGGAAAATAPLTLAVPANPAPALAAPAASAPAAVTPPGEKRALAVLAVAMAGLGAVLLQSLAAGHKPASWLALIGMNVVGTVGFNLMLRRSSWTSVDQWLTAAVLQTGMMLPFLAKEAVSPIKFPTFTPLDLLLLGIAVVCMVSLQFCNVKALQSIEASVYSVVFNARILFATLFGLVFLSETVGIWAFAGGLLIFAAIFVVRQRGTKAVTAKGIGFALGAALSMSIMNTCEKALIHLVGYQQYIFPMFTLAAIIMWLIVLVRRVKVPVGILVRPGSIVIMAFRASAGIGFSASLIFGSVAVSSYLSGLSVVLLVVCGMLFLGERDYIGSKLAATVAAIVGLTFILIGSFG